MCKQGGENFFWAKTVFIWIGILLHFVKHSRPDIKNVVGKLSKVIDNANQAAFLEMHWVITYVLDTKILELKIKPNEGKNEPHNIVYFSNSDYSGDPDTRRSVSESILFILDVPVSWSS